MCSLGYYLLPKPLTVSQPATAADPNNTYIRVYVCTCVCMYVYRNMYVYTCGCMCIWVHVCVGELLATTSITHSTTTPSTTVIDHDDVYIRIYIYIYI